jgi:hypothetical protein
MATNEAVLRETMRAPGGQAKPRPKLKPKSLAYYGYLGLILALAAGWMLRNNLLVDPEHGIGYWLGIIGGSMMLVLLIYPMRKRIRVLRFLGPTKDWFRMHMVLGLGGPLLVLYHCNFQMHSFNSTVALYSMLLVAGSGIIGRYFYARIHRGLYGQKTSLKELQGELAEAVEKSHGIAALMPGLVSELERLANECQGDKITGTIGAKQSLKWTFQRYFIHYSLYRLAGRELREKAEQSPIIAKDYKKLRRRSNRLVSSYVGLLGRVAQFSFYERLFSLWHVFHLPIFIVMVLAALVHVLAVHMY